MRRELRSDDFPASAAPSLPKWNRSSKYRDAGVFWLDSHGGFGLKRFGVLFLLLATAGLVTLSAQTKRTFTNPRPEPYFKSLFPNAGGFSTFGGTPLHYKVYDVDPKTNP
jgi:hypothetical protein